MPKKLVPIASESSGKLMCKDVFAMVTAAGDEVKFCCARPKGHRSMHCVNSYVRNGISGQHKQVTIKWKEV